VSTAALSARASIKSDHGPYAVSSLFCIKLKATLSSQHEGSGKLHLIIWNSDPLLVIHNWSSTSIRINFIKYQSQDQKKRDHFKPPYGYRILLTCDISESHGDENKHDCFLACSLVELDRRFKGAYRLYHQGDV
jgi:hypothetical protein